MNTGYTWDESKRQANLAKHKLDFLSAPNERFTMTGSKMTSMTLEEMREACARGEDRSDWEQVRRGAGAGVEPAPDAESPDAESPDAESPDAESPDASALLRAEIEKRRRGRPRGTTKVSTTVRFDREVLDAFRAAGPGWQSRMNHALKEWLKTHEQPVGPAGRKEGQVSGGSV